MLEEFVKDLDLATALFFKDKPFNERPDDPRQKHNNRDSIYSMHHLKVKAGWPVGILLSEKIHYANLLKKKSE